MWFLVGDLVGKIFVTIFGSANERALKRLRPLVEAVNSQESKMMSLSDSELKALTPKFKERLRRGETLDELLPEAFAAVREAARRFLLTHTAIPMRPFDVQVMGAIVLHQGKIAEMATGEGKTLVATMPAYLNSLLGRGVHIVTVNDYLAKRDAEWMGPIYRALGVSVGFIQSHMDSEERKKAYNCDITYGTNNEFGFDYLRDNMKMTLEEQVQRGHFYAIIDEVDSILIDEARTPLIISGPSEKSSEKYYIADSVARRLKRGTDYEVDEKDHTVSLTEEGIPKVERWLNVDNLYSPKNMEWTHFIEQALRAHNLFKRERDYIVKDNSVVIVDEFTGRLMPGRVWSDGLHQAVEAKEHLRIKEENQTLATITLQNYFRMYEKLAGMTGTAATEAGEFWKIYKLEVVVIPPNKPLRRTNYPDVIFRTEKEKFDAIEEEIIRVHETGRPILVGTRSIEISEMLSERLKRRGIKHEVLNAKHHEREALIVAQAGQMGAVTIATNMAGRGTDIILGKGVAELGGLHILGTERHEARRIDNQLRGRAGRQGDPGSSVFFISLEDELPRLFIGEKVRKILEFVGMKEGVSISHPLLSRRLEQAQKKVEERNFDIRRHLLEYDEVMNDQRRLVYSERQKILKGENLRQEMILPWLEEQVEEITLSHLRVPEEEIVEAKERLRKLFEKKFNLKIESSFLDGDEKEIVRSLKEKVKEAYLRRCAAVGEERMPRLERLILLNELDEKWKNHLYAMDQLRAGISLRSYAQLDPKVQYKKEGYDLFSDMISSLKDSVIDILFKFVLKEEKEEEIQAKNVWDARDFRGTGWDSREAMAAAVEGVPAGMMSPQQAIFTNAPETAPLKPIERTERKIGRNEPCPCGSGRKYKHCCGKPKPTD
ncbi:MAG: preprotein translocase subunit SecA [Planctomycetota bacterium]|nr:preprotein translocase subunit SecA [Planctomycetota bacterium]